LSSIIEEKTNKRHELIVAGDFNDDLNDPKGRTRNFMEDLGLREVLIEAYYADGPATHIRGSSTIDGIFTSNGTHIDQGRYLSLEKSPSNHRWIVICIPESSLIGKSCID
jgi:hypothetical protein